VLVDGENKTALVLDVADTFTHNVPETEKKRLRSMKTWPWK